MSSFQQRKQLTKNLLNPLQYQNRQGIDHQINQLLHQINSLNPSVDNYVYNNGAEAQLFKLHGTIPIVYKGTQYNIPVAFWFPLNFPQAPPICYVKPVQGMKVKAKHKHVDSQGLIYHPYLHGWAKNPNHSLVDLIGILCSAFGKEPPLYSQRQAPQRQGQGQGQGQGHIQAHAQAQAQAQAQPPPPQQQQAQQHMGMGGYANHYPNSNIEHGKNNNNNNNNNNNSSNNNDSDLRSRVEDKLRVELQVVYDAENGVLNSLANKRKQLETRKVNIDTLKGELESENALLVARASDLEKKVGSLEAWLKENEESEEMDVSKVVLPSDTWSDQCMNAVAQDVALTDVMLELDKALEDEFVTLDQYMKQIRKSAREQFMKRALARAVYSKQNEVVTQNNPALAAQAPQQPRGKPNFGGN